MSSDLDPLLKTLNLANTRKSWQQLVARAEKEDWPYDQFLHVLLSEELAHRRATRLAKASRAADFPFLRTIEEFDFAFQSTLRLASIGSLQSPDFVVEGRSVILFGKPGRGKTHLAIAIAYRAIQCGFEALFTTAAEMIEDLSTASRDGRLREALVRYVRPHVLIVDEVGYLSYGPDAANVLYHLVNERHVRKRALIFTTNKDPKRQWGAVLHDDDLAEAIVDRILERGRLLRLDGPSMRRKHLPPDELAVDDQVTSSSSRVSGKTAAEFPELTRAGAQLPIRRRRSRRQLRVDDDNYLRRGRRRAQPDRGGDDNYARRRRRPSDHQRFLDDNYPDSGPTSAQADDNYRAGRIRGARNVTIHVSSTSASAAHQANERRRARKGVPSGRSSWPLPRLGGATIARVFHQATKRLFVRNEVPSDH